MGIERNNRKAAVPSHSYDSNEAIGEGDTVIGGITVTKIIKEHHSIVARDGEESSIGTIVDKQLATMAANGDILQDIAINLNPEYWCEHLGPIYRENHSHLLGR